MNKGQLIKEMANRSKLQYNHCKLMLETFMDIVKEQWLIKSEVSLTGFGTFYTLNRKARTGVNPSTGNKMTIPSKIVPKFKPTNLLKIK